MPQNESIIRSGLPVPEFTGKTLFSKRAHNLIARCVRSLMNMQIRPGSKDAITYSENGVMIEYNSAPQAAASPVQIKLYRYKSMQSEHIVCRTWDGVNEGATDVKIAKRPKLRFSIAGEVIAGVAVAYSSYSTANQTRSATDGTFTEVQYITPLYLVNDPVYSIPCNTLVTVGGVALTEMDSDDSRAWGVPE